MVYRVYVEKKPQFAHEAKGLENDIIKILQIKGLKSLRVVNRYDVENIEENEVIEDGEGEEADF